MSKHKDEVTHTGRAVFYTVLWPSFMNAAKELGWSLGLHGSMANDMDMMAMPWTDEAAPVEDLVKALSGCVGETIWADHHFKEHSDKPHGRVVYTLSIYTDFYIDLSIIKPPSPDSYREALEKILKVATGDVWEPVVTIEEIARAALGEKEVSND